MSNVCIAVAASGGLDSTALLHCTARLAAAHGLEVHALHVHHGLQIEADRWQRQVAAQCRRWRKGGMPLHFHAHRIASRPAPGDSVEAWARNARYRALGEMARSAGCGLVLLAHHRRDQAETVLLQALRGAGPAGLSAMPGVVEREGLTWARPWLNQPRAVIEAYVRRWRLAFVEDPSNVDTRFARNRLRHDVWPAMAAGFSDVEVTLSAVARRAQEARALADEMAQLDLPLVSGERGLDMAAWAALSPGRRVNCLRHWLSLVLDAPVPESLVQRLLAELPGCAAGRWPTASASDGLRVHRGWLQMATPPPAAPPATPVWCPNVQALDLSRLGNHALSPWPGRIHVRAVTEGGIPADLLRQAQLRPRSGGERFQAHPQGPPRSLKKQFQSQQVPAWLRDGPLVYVADQLVCVPALGLDARAMAWPGSPRRSLHFER